MRTLDDILLEKREALSAILDVTGKQPKCIEDDDTEALLDCISQRQHLIDIIDELDKEAAGVPTEDAAVVMKLNEEIKALAHTILEQDKENEALATARLEEYRRLIRNYQDGSKSLGAYAQQVDNVPRSNYDVKQ